MALDLNTATLEERKEIAKNLPSFDVAIAEPAAAVDDRRLHLWKNQMWRGAEDDESDGEAEHVGWPAKGYMEWTAHLVVTHLAISSTNLIVNDFVDRTILITTNHEADGNIQVITNGTEFGEKTVAFINVWDRDDTRARSACVEPLGEDGNTLDFRFDTGSENTYDVTITVRRYMPDPPD